MRRFLCLLVSALMLCTNACAEARQGNVTLEVDAQAVLNCLTAAAGKDAEEMKPLAEALAGLAQGLKICYGWQDDGAYATITLKDTELLDLAVWTGETQAAMTTSLLSGHYVDITPGRAEAAASQEALELLESKDWLPMATDMLAAVDAWCAGLAVNEEYGNFMGDAYSGGVFRRSYTFDDKAVAVLVSSLMDVLDKHGINDELLDGLMGSNSLISGFLRRNNQIGEDNRYNYVLHQVYGLHEEPIGHSLIVTEAGMQVMTLSVAAADNGWRAIWGYGLMDRNYYIGLECIDGNTEGETLFAVAVYQDPSKEGFLAVEPFPSTLLLMVDGSLRLQESGWQAEAEVLDPAAPVVDTYYTAELVQQENGSSELEFAWYLSDQGQRAKTPVCTVQIASAPAQPLAWTTEGMEAIDMDDPEDVQVMETLVTEAVQELSVKLLRLIPVQLLMLLAI